MPFRLRYHPDFKRRDISKLNRTVKDRIRRAIETRLAVAPHLYGEPLRKTLRGYWKLRVGDYRVIFKIVEDEVWVLGICHRKEVYDKIEERL